MARLSEEEVRHTITLYNEHGNVWTVAKLLGKCGQSVHELLVRRGVINKINVFTEGDYQILRDHYETYVNEGRVSELAKSMNRTVPFITRKAKDLGLTDMSRPRNEASKKKNSLASKKWLSENDHPRGMLGKHHSKEVADDMRARIKDAWADPNSKFNSEEFKQTQSDNMFQRMTTLEDKSKLYSRANKYNYTHKGRLIVLRSSWEFNYCHFLNHLLLFGEILDWDYEPTVFVFHEVKRIVRSYTPDFSVLLPDNSIEYHEVKGWHDEKSKIRKSLMEQYYPEVPLKYINKKEYDEIELQNIPFWIKE